MNYQRMISILEAVKDRYVNPCDLNYSPYVCVNVGEVAGDPVDEPSEEQERIRGNISSYIKGEWSVRDWMNIRGNCFYKNTDKKVTEERIKMIDYLIGVYTKAKGEQT